MNNKLELHQQLFDEEILLDPPRLRELLASGIDPNMTDKEAFPDGWSSGRTPISKLLTDLYYGDVSGEDNFYLANMDSVLASCKLLIEAGAELPKQSDWKNDTQYASTLEWKIINFSKTVNPLILYLEEQGIDFTKTPDQQSCLTQASSIEVLKYLIEKGADVNEVRGVDENGQEFYKESPLGHLVIHPGDWSYCIVKTLVEAGADVNPKDCNLPPLLSACCSNYKAAEYLLGQGADPFAESNEGESTLTAVMRGIKELKKDKEYYEEDYEEYLRGMNNLKKRVLKIFDMEDLDI